MASQTALDTDTQASRCFGFVKFESPGDADLAVSQAHGKVCLNENWFGLCSLSVLNLSNVVLVDDQGAKMGLCRTGSYNLHIITGEHLLVV